MKIALIAHDTRKTLMQNFCIAYKGMLSKYELYATRTTGLLIEEVTGLTLHKYLPGHLGGVNQIETHIENMDMDLVIFMRDPIVAGPHENTGDNLMKLCDKYNVPFATNIASAELLIKAIDRGDLSWRETIK